MQLGFIIKLWFELVVILGRRRRRWEENSKQDLQDVGCGGMEWIQLLKVFQLNLQLGFIIKIWFEFLGLLGRRRRTWEDNIKLDLQEVGCGVMDWIQLLKELRLDLQLVFIIKIWFESLVILGRRRRRWEDNIKMDLQEVGCGGMDWIQLLKVFRLNLQLGFIIKIWFECLVIPGRRRRRWEDNIKMDLRKLDVGVWTGSSWLRIGIGGGHLWTR
jgi:hypothetical protein